MSVPFLSFDRIKGEGSRHHYFHFLWGYLLPAAHWVLSRKSEAPESVQMLSCGPEMDRILREAMAMVGVQVDVQAAPPEGRSHVPMPRWDLVLTHHFHLFGARDTVWRQIFEPIRFATKTRGLWKAIRPGELSRLRSSVFQLQRYFLRRSLSGATKHSAGGIVILKRSEETSFYEKHGAAEKKGYGAGRRSLVGIDQAAADLSRRGVNVSTFEPGAATFEEQIRVFHNAEGIVAIRGAEVANFIWMREGTRALILSPYSMGVSAAPIMLARLAGIGLIEEKIDGQYPVLTAEMIIEQFDLKELSGCSGLRRRGGG